jgi:hypothetical protein
VNVTVPPATVNSVAETWAVIVITVPLDGVSGVVNSEVVVGAAAHAAGPPTTNARALNSTGTHRPRDTCLEVIWRLNGVMGDWLMIFQGSNY